MKIYLIGMPGSGKTTLGQPLAEKLSLPFVDQDKEIESREEKTVQQIFAEQGEDYFRQIESQTLRAWAGSSKSFVMATGGGAPCFHNGIEVMNETGISIFLDVDVEQLLERVKNNKDRPLLHATDLHEKQNKLKSLYEKRLSVYRQAHLDIRNASVNSILEKLQLRK
jgi:shikimate kinase